jgi:hypothetical protein
MKRKPKTTDEYLKWAKKNIHVSYHADYDEWTIWDNKDNGNYICTTKSLYSALRKAYKILEEK